MLYAVLIVISSNRARIKKVFYILHFTIYKMLYTVLSIISSNRARINKVFHVCGCWAPICEIEKGCSVPAKPSLFDTKILEAAKHSKIFQCSVVAALSECDNAIMKAEKSKQKKEYAS